MKREGPFGAAIPFYGLGLWSWCNWLSLVGASSGEFIPPASSKAAHWFSAGFGALCSSERQDDCCLSFSAVVG